MRLPFRRKDKKKKSASAPSLPSEYRPFNTSAALVSPPSAASGQLVTNLPPPILRRIFARVCPHACEESYEKCENSVADGGCMLCDLRDLSHCAQACRSWRASAITVLYHSVRIDTVHYCKLEAFLAEKRKKKSRFEHNGIPEDPALARLRLFRRTVRDDPTRLGRLVRFLKTPYMIRESCHVELAQTIAVLPNLQYVDLPEGMFADEAKYATLRLEVQARCPSLRKMTYFHGSEQSFSALASGSTWAHLEVLELDHLEVDPLVLRAVLGTLLRLRALKVTDTPSFSDEVMAPDDVLPPLPALEELIIMEAPRMTSAGLVEYLSWTHTKRALRVLTLTNTGVQPWRLQEVLTMAPSLSTLAIKAKVSEPFPSAEGPMPLASQSLKTLRFEIGAMAGAGPYATPGYYSYVASSVLMGSLPKLRRIYVLDDGFPDKLSGMLPPSAMFTGGRARPGSSSSSVSPPSLRLSPLLTGPHSPTQPYRRHMPSMSNPNVKRFSSNNPFARRASGAQSTTHTLEVFAKHEDDDHWSFARVDAGPGSALAPRGRPISGYGLTADVAGQGWTSGEARRSVLIGNSMSGFLEVPGDQDSGMTELGPPRCFSGTLRPHSSGGESSLRSRGGWK
ncbi:hypothetical protein CDD81_3589 [Ophiocordyceps australis]|uniref:Uncharacterized protein n=1 Tax=Ophiocordyceps australis TaxID=1399860 RepID=A0A2C5YCG5_9HYPO|nr:hypothetical protein CDD81_3589 [Ophiocordyceps australis]